MDGLGDLLAELAEKHGPVTEKELTQARAEWPDRPTSSTSEAPAGVG